MAIIDFRQEADEAIANADPAVALPVRREPELVSPKPVYVAPDVALDMLIRCKLDPDLAASRLSMKVGDFLSVLPKDEDARRQIENAVKFYGLIQAYGVAKGLLDGLEAIMENAEAGDYVKGVSAATTALSQFMTVAKDAGTSTTVNVNVVDQLLATMNPEMREAAQTLFRPPKALESGE